MYKWFTSLCLWGFFYVNSFTFQRPFGWEMVAVMVLSLVYTKQARLSELAALAENTVEPILRRRKTSPQRSLEGIENE